MFMDLYYEKYDAKRRDAGDCPISYPYEVSVRGMDFLSFEEELQSRGFIKVASYEAMCIPVIYVNFTLKRYGFAQRPCKSSSMNDGQMSFDEFIETIYKPYCEDEEFRKKLENNYLESAKHEIEYAKRALLENLEQGHADGMYIIHEGEIIQKAEKYIRVHS